MKNKVNFFEDSKEAIRLCMDSPNRSVINQGAPRKWFSATDSEISIMGTITPFPWDESETSATDVMSGIQAIKSDRITLRINSMGGSVYEGVAIYSMLLEAGKPIDVVVEGMAGSVSSLIMQVGDTRSVSVASSVYLHKPFSGWHGMNAEDMIKEAGILDAIEAQGAAIYAERSSSHDADFFHRAMAEETTYTGQDIIDAGLADILRPLKKAIKSDATNKGMRKNLASARRTRLTLTQINQL